MADEVNVVVTQKVKPGIEAQVEALLREMAAETLAKDAGCLRYEWYRGAAPQTYVLIERWTDGAAVQAHLRAPHMAAIFEKLGPLTAEPYTSEPLARL